MIRNKVQQYFDANDITIPKAYHATKISRSCLTRLYRNEIVNVNLNTIDSLCKAFNCNFNDLFEFIPDEQMTQDDRVKMAERKLHVEYNTKLRRKGAQKTEGDDK
jgi:DNA-binding Xre family transcriptional regulator